MAEKEVVEVDNKSEPVLQNEEEDEEEQPSHDLLLLEDESDEFENIEVPSLQDEDEGRSFIALEFRQRLMNDIRRPSPRISRRRKKLDQKKDDNELIDDAFVEDIAHLTTDEDHIPTISTPNPSYSPIPPDTSLPTDMLISLLPGQLQVQDDGIDTEKLTPSPDTSASATDLIPKVDEETIAVARRMRLDSISLDDREYEDEDVQSPSWAGHRKHIFIFSLSGKPVYSRYGKEDKLVTMYGIMQALVSLVQDDKDTLRCVYAHSHKIVFLCKNPLVFVAVSRSQQSESQLILQLHYTYYQILSVLTNTQLQQIFDSNASVDLRHLLQGSEKFIDNILKLSDEDPSYLFSGIRCVAMNVSLRQAITTAMLQCRSREILFALLIANNQMITYIKPKDYNLHPMDIHLIFNLVDASTSFRSAESWTPICLPKFNDTGYLHAYVSYLPDNSPACLLLISTDKEKFFELQQCKEKIVERLIKHNLLGQINRTVESSKYTIDHLQAPEIRHFLYRSRKTLMVTSPQLPLLYQNEEDKTRLFDYYMSMNQRLHSHTWPTKILYTVGSKECLLGWRTANFDLYTIFDPLISKPQAIMLGNKLIRWINKEEERLIITSTTTF